MTRSIEIHASARVKGDINTPAPKIESGAVFDGGSSMENAVAPTPTRAFERRCRSRLRHLRRLQSRRRPSR
jgi:cytoskeletal protein CcmA (bactofilin family)